MSGTNLWAREILEEAQRRIDLALAGFVTDGKLNLSAPGTIGTLPARGGGTGNKEGEATPKDGSVTDAKVATGADIDPAKLDQALLLALAYTLVKGYLVAGTNITITPDDTLHHLMLASAPPVSTLDDLADVIITAAAAGDMLVAFEEAGQIVWRNVHGLPPAEDGALYVGGRYMTVAGATLTVGG